MSVPIVVPELGESVLDATIAHWLKQEGDPVAAGEPLVELETDKVNLEVAAQQAGILSRIDRKEQEDVKVGDVIGLIEETAQPVQEAASGGEGPAVSKAAAGTPEKEAAEMPVSLPAPPITPVAWRIVSELGVDPSQVPGSGPGGRVTRADVENFLTSAPQASAMPAVSPPAAAPPGAAKQGEVPAQPSSTPVKPAGISSTPQAAALPAAALPPLPARREERIKMTRRRRTIAQRLVEVSQTAAMLTTFNEADMTQMMDLRQRRNESFLKRYGVKLGITSFFVKAAVGALKAFPLLNAEVQGDEMLVKYYYDIGIAVGSPEGLVVPVLRDADRLSFAEIEMKIAEFAQKTDEGKLTLDDLRGGTFSITNGGVFGSLMSTPILTPPQVGILGLHKIEKRPVVWQDQVAIRPMMYLALSYDHRIVDGREAVQFLVRVKELIEDPESMLLES
jgi:2-oxoglutarate dehydrogenase E2 component (dihydrolipoamide succinyltransferase)